MRAAWANVTGVVADLATLSAADSDADNQDNARGGEAAGPYRAQCLAVAVAAAGGNEGEAVQAAGARVDAAVPVAGAGVRVAVQAARGSVDAAVLAAVDCAIGLVADGSTFSAPGSDAPNQNDAWRGEAAWPVRAQVMVVAVLAARAYATRLVADEATSSAAVADAD